MGRGLTARWARTGREIVVGSRDVAKARAAAEAVGVAVPGARARGAS
jgi:predicted dinucleotide-binding enzyme